MLYYLALWIKDVFDPPGFGVFQYISFRSAAAAITALIIAFYFGPKIVAELKKRQVGELAKPELQKVGDHSVKAGTPTMGGFVVLLSLLIPALLWADVNNAFVILISLTTLWLGGVGFLDDYLKVVKKKPKGLIGKYKLVGQIAIGLIVSGAIYFYPEWFSNSFAQFNSSTTVPFAKNWNFDFGIFYVPAAIFVITATSNAVNLTDGLDGLAIGTVGIAAFAFALIAYFTGNVKIASYLNIAYLQNSGELAVFCSALIGAALGFLWLNAYPAEVFMGDTGSLALGGALGALAVLLKKELLLPIIGGVFFAETISVIAQVSYYKYTKKKYGEGRRIFRMAPLHHHFEKLGWPEPKIVVRFYIIAIILAIIALTTFKTR